MDVGHRVVLLPLLLCSLTGGCADRGAAPAPSSSIRTPVAPDAVAVGEVPESSEEAFGLKLPQGLRVTKREFDRVTAEGSLAPEDVSNYIRSRVKEGDVETGPGRTSFLRANVLKPVTEWRGNLRIDVVGDGKFTQLRIFGEQTPPDMSAHVLPFANSADIRHVQQPGENAQPPPRL